MCNLVRILIIFFLVSSFSLMAQEKEDIKDDEFNTPPKKAIKVSPLEISTTTPSMPIGYERNLKDRTNLIFEAGLITNIWVDDYPFWGPKTRAEIRFYSKKQKKSPKYFAFDVMYKSYRQNRQEWRSRQNGLYDELITYKVNHTALATHFKFGMLSFFTDKLYTDAYFGLGVRWIHRRHIDVEADDLVGELVSETNPIDFMPAAGDYIIPSVTLGFKFGYKLE